NNPICCDRDGGNVDDTPATSDVYWGNVTSTTNNNTCNDLSYANVFTTDVLDMDENFMSYATATWMFSQGQVDVMMATLNASEMNGGRSSLKNSNISTNCSGIISSALNELNEKISIYPNPSNGKLFISTSEVIKSIKVTNIIGKEIYSNNNFNDNSIDLINFNNGVYFINLSTEKGTITKKIILTK
ncbi:MAG: T9SS type A sorting domain-containing protein, partial [Flavobacteriales bacterium]|nr:T9SS type A sorting domain-containing protein [Flavobacteriales bacterium]